MIKIENLNKSFKNFHTLKNLNLTVNKGEVYGFIGKNGAGKSTTMNIISGLSKLDSGKCIVNSKDVTEIQHPHELNIGYLPENPEFQGWLTAYETLEMLMVNYPKVQKEKRVIELLEWVGLEKAKDRRVGGFSRGMKQRLGMASALINNPELLILDEPSSALDPEGRADILGLIMDLKQKGKTVILSTHILSDVERVCDRIGLIKDGVLVLEKSLDDLMTDNNVPIIDVVHDGYVTSNNIENMEGFSNVLKVDVNRNMISLLVNNKNGIKKVMNEVLNEDLNIQSISLRKNTLEDLFIKEVNGK